MFVDDVTQISIEDLEDVGLYKLGHQKRFLLAIKRIKDLKAGKRFQQFQVQPAAPKMSHHLMEDINQPDDFNPHHQVKQVKKLDFSLYQLFRQTFTRLLMYKL